jgi:hypothetical protein
MKSHRYLAIKVSKKNDVENVPAPASTHPAAPARFGFWGRRSAHLLVAINIPRSTSSALAYTAITRAIKLVMLVGGKEGHGGGAGRPPAWASATGGHVTRSTLLALGNRNGK